LSEGTDLTEAHDGRAGGHDELERAAAALPGEPDAPTEPVPVPSRPNRDRWLISRIQISEGRQQGEILTAVRAHQHDDVPFRVRGEVRQE
jgi:hypothetical protein